MLHIEIVINMEVVTVGMLHIICAPPLSISFLCPVTSAHSVMTNEECIL